MKDELSPPRRRGPDASPAEEELRDAIARDGYAFVAAPNMRPLLGTAAALSDWRRFSATWNELPLDRHLPGGHRYRRRRHATFSARAGETQCRLEKHQPHYQGIEYNRLVGGIERWFEPIDAEIVAGASLRRILRFCLELFGPLRPEADWHVECHQFRIEARRAAAGLPTPEGVHRDGVDYVLVLLVNRVNIESGTTTVHGVRGEVLGAFTLSAPFDAALVDDNRVMHGVTAVQPIDPDRPAYRDVLVATFKAVVAPA